MADCCGHCCASFCSFATGTAVLVIALAIPALTDQFPIAAGTIFEYPSAVIRDEITGSVAFHACPIPNSSSSSNGTLNEFTLSEIWQDQTNAARCNSLPYADTLMGNCPELLDAIGNVGAGHARGLGVATGVMGFIGMLFACSACGFKACGQYDAEPRPDPQSPPHEVHQSWILRIGLTAFLLAFNCVRIILTGISLGGVTQWKKEIAGVFDAECIYRTQPNGTAAPLTALKLAQDERGQDVLRLGDVQMRSLASLVAAPMESGMITCLFLTFGIAGWYLAIVVVNFMRWQRAKNDFERQQAGGGDANGFVAMAPMHPQYPAAGPPPVAPVVGAPVVAGGAAYPYADPSASGYPVPGAMPGPGTDPYGSPQQQPPQKSAGELPYPDQPLPPGAADADGGHLV